MTATVPPFRGGRRRQLIHFHVRPVIAVTCLAAEARIAAGPGVRVLCGNQRTLVAALEAAIHQGSRGIISFGIAGGLAPGLVPGDWVVATGVVTEGDRFPTDRIWSRTLLNALQGAMHADVTCVETPVAEAKVKYGLRKNTNAVAVDMESHIAARIAAAHGVPFTVCRVIIDPAQRGLPPAALVDLRPDGTPNVRAIMRSLARRPSQLPALLRLAADARVAHAALLRGRRLLGAGLGFPEFGEVTRPDRGPHPSDHEFVTLGISHHPGHAR